MLVSVVITTLNRVESLRQVLQALRYQTYGSFEVIVMNKPSNDGTGQLLDALVSSLRRLIENRSLREELGASARRLYEERFTAKTMVHQTARAYADIAGRQRTNA